MSDPGPSGSPPRRVVRESLRALMARKKKELQESPEPSTSYTLVDPYANATASNYITRGQTGICYDNECQKHRCEWDDKYPENPHRLTHTFDAACRALSSVINLVTAVAKREVQNGIALVRPPGHHAMHEEYNGYCFFNNVAIAAEVCIKDHLASRILIVDIDVHHGQGTQRMFYGRKDVLYFSIHRYEHGTFWPNLLESNFNYIGQGEGLGYNVNIPLNAVGLTDDDYLAIVFSILLPVGYEFNPDLIIVSAGYDASVGCPEFNPDLIIVCGGYDACLGDEKGRMNVTPGFYSHLITLLSGMARGQIAVCLEGGYFLPTLAEGVAMTLKALLGGPCPILDPIKNIHPSVIESICNVKRALLNKWNCFKFCETIPLSEVPVNEPDEHKFQISYVGEPERPPFPTRKCYPENTGLELNYFTKLSKTFRERYKAAVNLPVYCVFDEKMLLHTPRPGDFIRPEKPERLTSILKMFEEFGIDKRVVKIPIFRRDFSAYNPHGREYFDSINADMEQTKDVYVNEHTRDAITIAASGLLLLADSIMNGTARCGVALIRPPGHHAEHNKAMGFCFANNIAIAANYLQSRYKQQRILIVDFDIHHGNGTQDIFYQSKKVMYISIHRDEDGKFFPADSARNYTYDGHGCGQGFNINIPFNKSKMGDTEYIAAFQSIVLPAAYSFSPQVVLVSAGFDAGINDPLGGYQVNPETFGHFIQMLKPLGEGRMILALEGGYNLTTTSYAMAICTKVLLGDPVIMPKNVYKKFSLDACETLRNVIGHFKKYYKIFETNKKLSITPFLCKKVDKFTKDTYSSELYRILDVEKVEFSDYVESEMKDFNASAEQ
ncbi:histone deacetylase 6 [Asbolus verrucosus]|uniref:Histone deacetylase 6 n=1 Tax=Asbolus verrucosus TaxID=1661398 RepID=A0A482VW48_ASBVE|nr:histone deacetylase 6 [Asbolus verrucosus]